MKSDRYEKIVNVFSAAAMAMTLYGRTPKALPEKGNKSAKATVRTSDKGDKDKKNF